MATSSKQTADVADPQAELLAAAEAIVEREQRRVQRGAVRAHRQRRERERQQLATVRQMQQSIEVIKWCMVGIAAVMFLGIAIAIWTLSALHGEVVRVKAEAEKFQPQVERVISEVTAVVDEIERVREAVHHPMHSIGGMIGDQLDSRVRALLDSRFGTEGSE